MLPCHVAICRQNKANFTSLKKYIFRFVSFGTALIGFPLNLSQIKSHENSSQFSILALKLTEIPKYLCYFALIYTSVIFNVSIETKLMQYLMHVSLLVSFRQLKLKSSSSSKYCLPGHTPTHKRENSTHPGLLGSRCATFLLSQALKLTKVLLSLAHSDSTKVSSAWLT